MADHTKVGPPQEPNNTEKPPSIRVRTISAMDEEVLAQMEKSTESLPKTNNNSNSPNRSSSSVKPGRPPLPQKSRTMSRDSSTEQSMDSLSFSPEVAEHKSSSIQRPPPLQSHHRRHTGEVHEEKYEATMANPNIQATIRCVCGVLKAHISNNRDFVVKSPVAVHGQMVNLHVFADHDNDNDRVPSLRELEAFYNDFYQRAQMEQDTIILSLVYVERLVKDTEGQLQLTPANYKSVVFSCMIMASKVWDDLSMWNIDFSNCSRRNYSLQRINELEVAVLQCLGFNVKVPASVYAKYYFWIRNIQGKLGTSQWEVPTKKEVEWQYNSRLRRSQSVDWVNGKMDWNVPQTSLSGPVLADDLCLKQLHQ